MASECIVSNVFAPCGERTPLGRRTTPEGRSPSLGKGLGKTKDRVRRGGLYVEGSSAAVHGGVVQIWMFVYLTLHHSDADGWQAVGYACLEWR